MEFYILYLKTKSATLSLFCCIVVYVRMSGAQSTCEVNNSLGGSPPIEPGPHLFKIYNDIPCHCCYRSFSGACTSNVFRLNGAAQTAQYSYWPKLSSKIPRRGNLPSARFISNFLCAQSSDKFNDRNLSEFVVYFGLFLAHNIISSTTDATSPRPIPISKDDPIFANFSSGFLPFSRQKRANPIPQSKNGAQLPDVERPINTISSALDLQTIYGSDTHRIGFLRSFKGGELLVSDGNLLPFNTRCLANAPASTDPKWFVTGDRRANENGPLIAFYTLFMREHNTICRKLRQSFPLWHDELLFQEARKINIAQFQKIVYEEFLPTFMGRKLRKYKGFKRSAVPGVSIEFVSAAYRLGHTMVGNEVTLRGPNMTVLSSIPMSRAFFPRSQSIVNSGISVFLRGAMAKTAQEIDVQVRDMLRNFLFTSVEGVTGVDLIAVNLQRGRDNRIPTYNQMRKTFTGLKARWFSDITNNLALQSRLQTTYGSVDKIDAWIGLLAEDHVPGSSLGKTMLNIWKKEFIRSRDSDRFFYRRKNLFAKHFWRKFPYLRMVLRGKNTMNKLLMRNSAITAREIGPSVWFTN